MTEEQARAILGDAVQPNNSLRILGGDGYLSYTSHGGAEVACLDGLFTADMVEAIAWWMRNKETTS